MTVTTEFNLPDTVRKVYADGVGPDPKEVAAKVLELIPIGLERDVLAALLPRAVQDILRADRHGHRHAAFAGIRSGDGTRTKWASVAKAMLEDPFEVEGKWIVFGDLTKDNLKWLIGAREKASAELAQEVTRLSNLLILMQKQRASTVRKLPLEMIEKVMS